jgi:hypothetical protein
MDRCGGHLQSDAILHWTNPKENHMKLTTTTRAQNVLVKAPILKLSLNADQAAALVAVLAGNEAEIAVAVTAALTPAA